MAIRSGFFMSVEQDRLYDASFFAEYFASFIGNGVFPNPATNLQVITNDDMWVKVKAGTGWIDGYVIFNDSEFKLKLSPADGLLNRIDRIVMRWDLTDREIKIEVKEGVKASKAVAPELQRDADGWELALADVSVKKGIISITQADITDTRLDKELCGIVHGTVEQVDTTAIFDQFNSWYEQTKTAYDSDIAIWTQDKKDAFDSWYTSNTIEFKERFDSWYTENTTGWVEEFTAWFDTVKGQLEGDLGTSLVSSIAELESNKVDKVIGKDLSANDYTNAEKAEVAKVKNKAEKSVVDAHLADNMPHQFVDGVKTYRWGFRTLNGSPQFIYEEVI